jgi:hypothetical protein
MIWTVLETQILMYSQKKIKQQLTIKWILKIMN